VHLLPGRLFTPALDGITVVAAYDLSYGWRMSMNHRHSGEGWSLCPVDRYDHLVAGELHDVTCAAMWELLALDSCS
jgi:hypothetical protein